MILAGPFFGGIQEDDAVELQQSGYPCICSNDELASLIMWLRLAFCAIQNNVALLICVQQQQPPNGSFRSVEISPPSLHVSSPFQPSIRIWQKTIIYRAPPSSHSPPHPSSGRTSLGPRSILITVISNLLFGRTLRHLAKEGG